MKILLTGSTGLVGRAAAGALGKAGHEVIPAVRGAPRAGALCWDPAAGKLDSSELEGFGAVVHLAGENVGKGRWTREKKQRIWKSRTSGTELLCRALAGMREPPRVLVSASALGYYGSRGEEWLTEQSQPGQGFLSELCQAWEGATEAAGRSGIRVVLLRIGVVLSAAGGALAAMLPAFRLGLGGPIGGGGQHMSWIALDDLARAVVHAISAESLAGPVNATAPAPVTNREFSKTLGRVLRRPAVFPMPAAAASLAFGREKARELFLSSARLRPARLLETGFSFAHPELEGALRHALAEGPSK